MMSSSVRGALLGVLTLGVLSACWDDPPPPPPEPTLVQYVEARMLPPEETRSFSGLAQAGEEVNLSFRVPGTVTRISVKVGDRVTPGMLVAELDPTDFRLQVQEAEAGLQQAQAQARNAAAQYDRIRGLYENGAVAKQDLDAGRAAAESAAAAVTSVEQRVALAKRQLGFAKLTAPSTGAVASVEVSPNENVGAGNPVMMLTAGDAPEVSISVPESMVGRLQSGQLAQARFDALAGRSFPATVQEIGVASTGAATTFPVVLALQGAGDAVRSGMAADVTFSFSRNQSGVAVPSSAVGEDAEGRYVYVLDAAEGDTATVRKVTVAIGDLIDAGLVVTSGLSGGERLISAGQAKVLPGQTVKGTRAPERSQ